MATRKRIGIIYNYNENWIGGAYYIQNLIRSLNCLPNVQQIDLYILTKKKSVFKELQEVTGYSKLKFIEYQVSFNKMQRLINRISYKLLKKKLIVKKIKLDCVFPLYFVPKDLEHIKNLFYWIPDLQEKYLPHLFSNEEIESRDHCCNKMILSKHPIVFSSQAALSDFNHFYPNTTNIKFVLPFAVTHPDLIKTNIELIKLKYNIKGDYFISPNQFWQHKNQIAIIEASKILKERQIEFKIVFTGKEHDYRNPDYTTGLKQKVKEYQLENQIIFLGFIDREDQLLLMQNAEAVIQPSLFEGWSTVVEDAKAYNQTIIVSKIAVHQEQLGHQAYYFDTNNYCQLADKIEVIFRNPHEKIIFKDDYNNNIAKFASNFLQIIDNKLN